MLGNYAVKNSNNFFSATQTIAGNLSATGRLTVGVNQTNNCTGSSILGGAANSITNTCSTIGGGGTNTVSGYYSFLGGGTTNSVLTDGSFIGAGGSNTITGSYAVIVGGFSIPLVLHFYYC